MANVLVVDKLTYAGNLDSLKPVANAAGFAFVQADICDAAALHEAFARSVGFAAQTIAQCELIVTCFGGTCRGRHQVAVVAIEQG